MSYYILDEYGQQVGPYSFEELRAMWVQGQITFNTKYWVEGLADWQPLWKLKELVRPAASKANRRMEKPAISLPAIPVEIDGVDHRMDFQSLPGRLKTFTS